MDSWDLFPLHFILCLGAQTAWLTAEICQRGMMRAIKHLPQCSTGWQKVQHCKQHVPTVDVLAQCMQSSCAAVILTNMHNPRMIYLSVKIQFYFVPSCLCREGCGRPLVWWSKTVQLQPPWILIWNRWALTHECVCLSASGPFSLYKNNRLEKITPFMCHSSLLAFSPVSLTLCDSEIAYNVN